MEIYKRLLAYAKPYSKYWPSYLLLSVLSVIFGVANYALIDPLLTVLFQPQDLQSIASIPDFSMTIDYFKDIFQYYLYQIKATNGILHSLLYVCFFLMFASFLANLTRYFSQKVLVNMKTYIMKNVRTDLYKQITKLHIGYFNNSQKGNILSTVSNDVNEVQNTVASSFHIMFREPLLIIGFLVGLFYMSWRLTIVTIFTLPISAFVIGGVSRKLKAGTTRTQSLLGQIISQFEESISGSRIIKAFNAQKYVRSKFDNLNEEHKQVSRSIFSRQEMASPLSEFLGIAVAVAVLFYGGWLQIHGDLNMTLPKFTVYIAFYWRVLEPSKAIATAYANIQRGLVSGQRIFSILDAKPAIKNCENPIPLKDFNESIDFQNVSFKYAKELVLKNINMKVQKGQMIALVGPSGAGKSTIADLLPRFYDVTDGHILIDGHDIREYNQKDLISLLGIVTQESILFNDTVKNNICFGMTNVKDEDVVRAARIANAHDFISQMSEGYNTNIGDCGANLSGGQRQRVAIARAVLKNPPILILDEATSALDTESERLVQDALTNLMKNRTSLVIAHRLSTIQHADEIVVLKDGEIAERGNHEELLNAKGEYYHLCQLQTF
ncbi:MAG: ABC transporter ATP-binding protein [Bacteroidales bacterium]